VAMPARIDTNANSASWRCLAIIVEATKTFTRAARAGRTRQAYSRAWAGFDAWCRQNGRSALPATQSTSRVAHPRMDQPIGSESCPTVSDNVTYARDAVSAAAGSPSRPPLAGGAGIACDPAALTMADLSPRACSLRPRQLRATGGRGAGRSQCFGRTRVHPSQASVAAEGSKSCATPAYPVRRLQVRLVVPAASLSCAGRR
jgi:hypothetical protein